MAVSALSVIGTLSSEDSQRLSRYAQGWRFYKGDQWGPTLTEEPQITINYVRPIVNKSVSFLFGKKFKLAVPVSVNPEIGNITLPLLNDIWDDNHREILSIEMGQAGGVTGDVFVKVGWEEPELDQDGQPYDELHPNGKPRILLLPGNSVFPTWHPHDKDTMLSCTIQYGFITKDREGYVEHVYKEVITKESISVYIDDQLIGEPIPNALREINVVHIKNLPVANESYGVSDIADLIPVQAEFNFKTTDISDIIDYHAAPVTIIKGARTRQLEKGARKVWGGLPKDADVFNLTLESDLTASNTFLDKLRVAIFELSNTPEESLGARMAISNTSGIALQVKYGPLLEKTWIKQATYGTGIQRINKLLLKLAMQKGTDEQKAMLEAALKRYGADIYRTEVRWGDPLPKDEEVVLKNIAQKINMGIEEPEGALKVVGYEGDVTEKLAKVEAWMRKRQSMMFDLASEGDYEPKEEPVEEA